MAGTGYNQDPLPAVHDLSMAHTASGTALLTHAYTPYLHTRTSRTRCQAPDYHNQHKSCGSILQGRSGEGALPKRPPVPAACPPPWEAPWPGGDRGPRKNRVLPGQFIWPPPVLGQKKSQRIDELPWRTPYGMWTIHYVIWHELKWSFIWRMAEND